VIGRADTRHYAKRQFTLVQASTAGVWSGLSRRRRGRGWSIAMTMKMLAQRPEAR